MSMRIVFFGTPEHGAPFLHSLLTNKKHRVVGVVIPAKKKAEGIGPRACLYRARLTLNRWIPPKGTTQDLTRRAHVPIWYWDLDTPAFAEFVARLEPDLFVVASFTRILKPQTLSLAPLGVINVHPSLLPKNRGADPIFWAIRNGERQTGVTIHWMDPTLDTGPIMQQRSVVICDGMNSTELARILCNAGIEILAEALDQIEEGQARREVQNEEEASYFPPASETVRTICWDEHADSIIRLVRASSMLGGAFASLNNLKVKVIGAEIMEQRIEPNPGRVLAQSKNRAIVACRDAAVCVHFG